ncbi:hypothetical protein C3V43_14110 [Bacteroides heparinolyticus]|nr:hypothetical protein C3V43_14110 [Bacteroides heparinolyticus]
MVIQNSVPQSTPLISKSLPIHLSLKGNTLLLNKIVRKRKIFMEMCLLWPLLTYLKEHHYLLG